MTDHVDNKDTGFSVQFWGVRGSISTSDPDTCRYGGNTSSLELLCGDRRLGFDAGTGNRDIGQKLSRQKQAHDIDVFLTHTHYDHICGIPFFTPFFVPGNKFRIWAGHLLPQLTVRKVLSELMMAPLFPVPPEIFGAQISFKDFKAGEKLTLDEAITVQTAPLNHPNGATGYRVEFKGKSICYVTDTEHVVGQPDQNILKLVENADILIYDSMYTDTEFRNRVGWGHSTWQEGVRLSDLAGVKRFVVFHHDPDHDDGFMDHIAQQVDAARPGSIVAREGMVLQP